jgi:predicted transcriptional regulator
MQTVASRAHVIECLLDGVTDKRDLQEQLDVSRTTVDRAFHDLEEIDAVRSSGSDYELTLSGRLAYESYEQLTHKCQSIATATPLLLQLPIGASVDVRVLKEADVSQSKPCAPHEPIRQLEELIERGDHIRAFLPVVLQRYLDLFYDQITESNIEAELILGEDIVEVLSKHYSDEFRAIVQSDACELLTVPEAPPFGLVEVDAQHVWLGVHEEGGGLRGAMYNETEDAVNWGMETYQRFRNRATRGVTSMLSENRPDCESIPE